MSRSVKNPYLVKYLTHDFFKSYAPVSYYKSIRPGFKTGDPVVTDIRCIMYTPEGIMKYKLLYSDEWQPLPKRPARGSFLPTRLYSQPRKLSKMKFNQLQELKQVLPSYCWEFYDNLPHD